MIQPTTTQKGICSNDNRIKFPLTTETKFFPVNKKILQPVVQVISIMKSLQNWYGAEVGIEN